MISVATGVGHSCGTNDDGTAMCWGFNGYGQLGNGSTDSSPDVEYVAGLSTAASSDSSLGWYHSCLLLSNGMAACWGSNQYGQLGDGTTIDRLTPGIVPNVAPAQ
jgi:alpha-tubulin suppressor-like RCC1 family protein